MTASAMMRPVRAGRWSTMPRPSRGRSSRLPGGAAGCLGRVLHVRRSGPPLAGTMLQASCDFGNVPALEAGALKLVLARLARAVAARDRGRTVGCATGDLVHPGLAGK